MLASAHASGMETALEAMRRMAAEIRDRRMMHTLIMQDVDLWNAMTPEDRRRAFQRAQRRYDAARANVRQPALVL